MTPMSLPCAMHSYYLEQNGLFAQIRSALFNTLRTVESCENQIYVALTVMITKIVPLVPGRCTVPIRVGELSVKPSF